LAALAKGVLRALAVDEHSRGPPGLALLPSRFPLQLQVLGRPPAGQLWPAPVVGAAGLAEVRGPW